MRRDIVSEKTQGMFQKRSNRIKKIPTKLAGSQVRETPKIRKGIEHPKVLETPRVPTALEIHLGEMIPKVLKALRIQKIHLGWGILVVPKLLKTP